MRQQSLPPLWRAVGSGAGLSEAQLWHGWASICRARWSVVREWKQTLVAADALTQTGEAAWAWAHAHASPHQLVDLLENLVRERQLSRRSANALMEKVLARVDKHGAWK